MVLSEDENASAREHLILASGCLLLVDWNFMLLTDVFDNRRNDSLFLLCIIHDDELRRPLLGAC